MTASYESLGNAPFADRHIGPRSDDLAKMLAAIGAGSLDELIDLLPSGGVSHWLSAQLSVRPKH